MENYDVKVPKGQINYNTVAGSIGLANAVFGNGGWLGGLFGGRNCQPQCNENTPVTRYDLEKEQEIAAKDSEIALLKANTYQDQKSLELYKYIDAQLNVINSRLAAQDVRNQGVADAFREIQKDIDYKVNLEAERRECADCKIVNYANSTFATKLVTNYAAGTTSDALPTYNPLACGTCCNG